jgi:hypothetical protein
VRKPKHDWQAVWDSRIASLEKRFGPSARLVGHAVIPLELGAKLGGSADVVYFRKSKLGGTVTSTADCVLTSTQKRTSLGQYELVICERGRGSKWGEALVSNLATYTLKTPIRPMDTMDLQGASGSASVIAGLLFVDYGRITVLGRRAGLLLCIGITKNELAACLDGKKRSVLARLKRQKVFPFTIHRRKSVI